jgi:hypothetical protein
MADQREGGAPVTPKPKFILVLIIGILIGINIGLLAGRYIFGGP